MPTSPVCAAANGTGAKVHSDIVVVGAGGHAKVVVELARACGFIVRGCVDADATPREVVGAPVLGDDTLLPRLFANGVRTAAIGLGDNQLRFTVYQRLLDTGFALPALVSPTAIVSPSVSIGDATVVMGGSVINADTAIGCCVIVNTRASVDHDVMIGNGAHVAPGATIAGSVHVGQGALIGAGSTVLPGVTIGDAALVGGGSLVNRDVAAGTRVVGVPARLLQKER